MIRFVVIFTFTRTHLLPHKELIHGKVDNAIPYLHGFERPSGASDVLTLGKLPTPV